ncbi:unnamed protein product [Knipowitschia caucasica]
MELCDIESFIFDPDVKSELEVHNGQQWKDCVSDTDRSIYWVQNGNELRPQYRTTSPHHTGRIEVTFEVDQTKEDYDEEDETSEEEGGKKDDASSDEDWLPLNLEETAEVRENIPSDEFSDEELSDEELNEKMQKKKQLCTDCGTFYRTENHICEHKTKHYVCNVCGKRCVTPLSLKIHSHIHSEAYEHYCKYCYTSFKTKLNKLAHEKNHHNEKNPYKCRYCTATFCTHAERRKHVKQHTGPNAFKCEICGFATGKKHKLRHMMIHTGVKPFICVICGRTFNQSGNLKSHMRVHTGEQPYKCQHCGRSFNHNVSLKSHVQRCHPPESGDNNLMKSSDDVSDADENVQQQDTETVQQETVKKTGRGVTGRRPGRPKKSLDESEKQNSDKGKKKKKVQSKRNLKSGSD